MIKFSLRRKDIYNTFAILISSVVLAASNWAQLSLLTKNVDIFFVGVYTLALAYSNPLYQFSNLQLRPLYVTDRNQGCSFNQYFSLRLFSVLITILIGFILSVFIYQNYPEGVVISVSIFILYGIDGIIDIFNARLHYNESLVKISISIILRSILSFLGLVIGVTLLKSVIIGVNIAIVLKFCGFLLYDYNLFKKENYSLKVTGSVFLLLKKSFPLGISLLISSLNINISKYFVNYLFGVEMQGVYSSIFFIIAIGTLFVATIGQIVMPKISVFYIEKKWTSIKKMHGVFLSFILLIGLCLLFFSILWGKPFLFVFFSKQISDYSYLFPWIMGSAIFVYLASANGYTLTATSIIKEQVFLGITALLVNITLNLLFINRSTIQLIVLYTAIAFMIQFILGYILLMKRRTLEC